MHRRTPAIAATIALGAALVGAPAGDAHAQPHAEPAPPAIGADGRLVTPFEHLDGVKARVARRATTRRVVRRVTRRAAPKAAPAPAPAATAGGAASSHAFIVTDPKTGRPARWNPCAPIRVAVHVGVAPASARADVQEALTHLSLVSGLTFAVVGETAFVPRTGSDAGWPGAADMVVAFTTPHTAPELAGGVAGYGGPRRIVYSKQGDLVTTRGSVVIDGEQAIRERWRGGIQPGVSTGTVVLHELAHAIGLGHVGDRSQVMFPTISTSTPRGFANGDRAGLVRLGPAGGGCLSE